MPSIFPPPISVPAASTVSLLCHTRMRGWKIMAKYLPIFILGFWTVIEFSKPPRTQTSNRIKKFLLAEKFCSKQRHLEYFGYFIMSNIVRVSNEMTSFNVLKKLNSVVSRGILFLYCMLGVEGQSAERSRSRFQFSLKSRTSKDLKDNTKARSLIHYITVHIARTIT